MNPPVFPIADILQARAHAGKTGRLIFEGTAGLGEIYLLQGRILHARLGEVMGEAALYTILKWGACPWDWIEGEITQESSVFQSIDTMLVNYAFVADLSEKELIERFGMSPSKRDGNREVKPLSLVVGGGEIEPFRCDLIHPCIILGRDPLLCNLAVSDRSISNRHGMFLSNGSAVRYEDLGSTNGSWKNGELFTDLDMHVGDIFNAAMVSVELVDFSELENPKPSTDVEQLKKYSNLPNFEIEPLGSDLKPIPAKPMDMRTTMKLNVQSIRGLVSTRPQQG